MTLLPASHPLTTLCRRVLMEVWNIPVPLTEMAVERLVSTRQVLRFSFPATAPALVGKFFGQYPPATAQDRSLEAEFRHYQEVPGPGGDAWLTAALPRCLGRWPGWKLGLLLEAVPGPDLDFFLAQAGQAQGREAATERLRRLARFLARFHGSRNAVSPVSPQPALLYLAKLTGQLSRLGVLSPGQERRLAAEAQAWEPILRDFPDQQVLLHGDATPTNFLFPDGEVVALDLERLGWGDRLIDLSWVAGELKHAFGWRFQDFAAAEPLIGAFFGAYLQASAADDGLARRLFRLNPFYMALAELRIARNSYLTPDYRQHLVNEAFNCLTWGRGNL